ncbi:hypothetical protein [Salinibaculum rarum]|uniref:hypothetical protein n=1 Tax=Salinibaculum rarum TaxID=3058903 RepID=UPI00265F7DCF|nr:hypothetical protein [Salinibaculum sp. KK48]
MHTITDSNSQLPDPPISAADVPIDELPEVPLDAAVPQALFQGIHNKSRQIARQRDESKTGSGELYGTCGRTEAHEIGHTGELVAGGVLGLDLDEKVYADGDPGYDHQVGDYTIDTKTTATEHSRPRLVVSTDVPAADWFLLVHLRLQEGVGRIIGFRDRATVQEQSLEYFPRNNLNHVLDWDQLYPIRYFSSLVAAQGVTKSLYDDWIDARGCQKCGALLDDDSEHVVHIDEHGLETDLSLCPECADLISAAAKQGYATEYTLYRRPDEDT